MAQNKFLKTFKINQELAIYLIIMQIVICCKAVPMYETNGSIRFFYVGVVLQIQPHK